MGSRPYLKELVITMNPETRLLSHYTLLTYPFEHAIEGADRAARLKKLAGRWQHAWSRFEPEGVERLVDDTYFFLPHIRELLFPETTLLSDSTKSEQLSTALKIARRSPSELVPKLPAMSMLRLTYNPGKLEALHPLQLEFTSPDAPPDSLPKFAEGVRISWVDVHLFPQGIGLLTLRVELNRETITVASLADFLYYVRIVHPLTVGWQLATWRQTSPSAGSEGDLTFNTRDLIDFLLQGLTRSPKEGTGSMIDARFEDFLARLHQGTDVFRYSDTPWGQGYGATLREYTYTCLDYPTKELIMRAQEESGEAFVPTGTTYAAHHTGPSTQPLMSGNTPPTHQTAPKPVQRDVSVTAQPLFESGVQQVLYELATGTLMGDPLYNPHPQAVESILKKGYIALWANWQGLALHDNVVFLGASPGPFTSKILPSTLQGDYFNVYLLTLYQNMRLSLFFSKLIRPGDDLGRNLKEARELGEAFTMFRNHYWFPEVAIRTQGNELYHRFSSGLGVQGLFKHTEQEMQVLGEFYERKAARRIETLLNLLAFFVVPAEIIVHFFAHTVIHEATWLDVGLWTAVAYLFAVVAWFAWKRWGPE